MSIEYRVGWNPRRWEEGDYRAFLYVARSGVDEGVAGSGSLGAMEAARRLLSGAALAGLREDREAPRRKVTLSELRLERRARERRLARFA